MPAKEGGCQLAFSRQFPTIFHFFQYLHQGCSCHQLLHACWSQSRIQDTPVILVRLPCNQTGCLLWLRYARSQIGIGGLALMPARKRSIWHVLSLIMTSGRNRFDHRRLPDTDLTAITRGGRLLRLSPKGGAGIGRLIHWLILTFRDRPSPVICQWLSCFYGDYPDR